MTLAAMLRSRRLIALLAVLAVAAVACGGGGGADTGTTGTQPQALLPRDRLELPTFNLQRFEALLEEQRGIPVVVNIWASWCGPCRIEAPDLEKLSREFEGRVQFIGVDILDDREAARDFILEFDWPYPSVFDADGERSFEWNGAVNEELLRAEIEKVV